MSTKFFLNRVGFPLLRETNEQSDNLPGIGEKIILETTTHSSNEFEVTEVKRDPDDNSIHVYVNSV